MDSLQAIPFGESLVPKIQSLDFGTEEWSRLASDWLKDPAKGAKYSRRDRFVWIYVNDNRQIVGFSSLGRTSKPELSLEKICIVPTTRNCGPVSRLSTDAFAEDRKIFASDHESLDFRSAEIQCTIFNLERPSGKSSRDFSLPKRRFRTIWDTPKLRD